MIESSGIRHSGPVTWLSSPTPKTEPITIVTVWSQEGHPGNSDFFPSKEDPIDNPSTGTVSLVTRNVTRNVPSVHVQNPGDSVGSPKTEVGNLGSPAHQVVFGYNLNPRHEKYRRNGSSVPYSRIEGPPVLGVLRPTTWSIRNTVVLRPG